MSSSENAKLCDFTSTNNNDFICSPLAAPATKSESYEMKPALLNLVMKEQFSGASTDDAAFHLNNFVELCDMQKYKEVEIDIIKLKLFPFSLRGELKNGYCLCLKIALILELNAKMLLFESTIQLLKLYN